MNGFNVKKFNVKKINLILIFEMTSEFNIQIIKLFINVILRGTLHLV